MILRPPCELVQKEYLPLVRATVTRILSDKGLSQTDIGSKLGITQAAVSKYLRDTTRSEDSKSYIDDVAKSIAKKLLSKHGSKSEALYELCAACMLSRIGSDICHHHSSVIPDLAAENCRICSDLLSGENTTFTTRAKIVPEMYQALDLINQSTIFPTLMPEVRPNLVACEENATSVNDVLAIPGRISLVKGRARALLQPQFGASHHTAEFLLWAKETWHTPRACLSLRGQDDVVAKSEESGFTIIRLQSACREVKDIIDQLASFKPIKESYIAVSVPGGIGVEPILYTFGPSVVSLVELVLKVASLMTE